jgi:pyruvate formate-lyase/glycerol dehydratase family glycyl radical enzyme
VSRSTERIDAIRSRVAHSAAYQESIATLRREVCAREFAFSHGQPQVIRVAKVVAAFLREKDVPMVAGDVFAGHSQYYDFEMPLDLPCFDGPIPGSILSKENVPLALSVGVAGDEVALMEQFLTGLEIGLVSTCLGGHVIVGYDRVLATGFAGLAAMAREQDGDFARASVIIMDAACDYARRYSGRARELAVGASEADAPYLDRIAEACERLAVGPARTFFEAIQSVVLTHEILTCEQPCSSLSLGRVDQYLYPYYQADITAGAITEADAREWIEGLWLKIGSLEHSFQNVTLGGADLEGRDQSNELTAMGLEATRRLKLDQPLVSLRYHAGMSDAVWDRAIDLIGEGLGFPALFNDPVVIDAKQRVGLSREDATNYGIVGCVEMVAPGAEWSQTEAVRLNWAKVLELMLNDGVCTRTGKQTTLAADVCIEEIETFEDFYDAFGRVFAKAIDLLARGTMVRDRGFGAVYPYPFLSSTMDGPLANGTDVSSGGARYNALTMNGCGMADLVDSLGAIRECVYSGRAVSLVELAEALRTDFAGRPELKSQLAAAGERFGNDAEAPDAMLRDLVRRVHEQLASYAPPRGGVWQMGLYTVDAHAYLGKQTGALPSGRGAGVSLANGCSPCQGADTHGPTAAVRSVATLDHRMLGNGMVLDLKFAPSLVKSEAGRGALRGLIETYFAMGGMEIQFNVVDAETLEAAKADPDAYRDLIVRVSGFSAYFTTLDPVTQDEIIARTEHGSVD